MIATFIFQLSNLTATIQSNCIQSIHLTADVLFSYCVCAFCGQICDINQKFHTLARVAGREDFKLQSLVWAARPEHSNRLFGISLRGFIFEVRLTRRVMVQQSVVSR